MITAVLAILALAMTSEEEAHQKGMDALWEALELRTGHYPTFVAYILWPVEVMHEDLIIHGEHGLEDFAWQKVRKTLYSEETATAFSDPESDDNWPSLPVAFQVHAAGIRDPEGPGEEGAVWVAIRLKTTGHHLWSKAAQDARDKGLDPENEIKEDLVWYLRRNIDTGDDLKILGVDGPGLARFNEGRFSTEEGTRLEGCRLLGIPCEDLEDRVRWGVLGRGRIAARSGY